ncbi:MAG: hypothetical protein C6W56_02595 [Caldibacillus debilis]|nr:hypothetical protein [Bacillaceae bacterium]REJ30535.1 MAG: hypothetical protein C6W56_02595 [Caldibacillus debilis]
MKGFKLKKALLYGLFLVVLFILGLAAYVYQSASNPLRTEEESALERALAETPLVKAEKVDWFHYLDQYVVIKGKNRDGENIIVWVPKAKDKDITVKKESEGLTEREALAMVREGLALKDDQRPKEIVRVKLGMIENTPVYEISYIDQKGRYSFLYIDFYEGNWYRVYNL